MTGIPISAVILAGGLGTRLRDTVPDVPKPMAPINGRPFLEYLLDYWHDQGIRHFTLSVGYKHEIISGHFGDRYKKAKLDYAIETTPLGTGGGLLLATQFLTDDAPFVLLNGDTYFAVDLQQLTAFSYGHDSDWTFSLFRTSDTARYMGLDVTPAGAITALKSTATQDSCLANGGIYLVNPRALAPHMSPNISLSLENNIFPAALASGQRLYGIEFSAPFIDIGVPQDYLRAADIIT